MLRTTDQLLEFYTQGFVDTRVGAKVHRPQSIEPAYVLGANFAKIYPKMDMIAACTMFHMFLQSKLELPAAEPTTQPITESAS